MKILQLRQKVYRFFDKYAQPITVGSRIAFLLCILSLGYFLIIGFQLFNTVPNRNVEIDLNRICEKADSSICDIAINMNYSGKESIKDTLKSYNIVRVMHYSISEVSPIFNSEVLNRRKDDLIYLSVHDTLKSIPKIIMDSISAVYSINYKCGANVDDLFPRSSGFTKSNSAFAYTYEPSKHNGENIDEYTYIEGGGIVTFPLITGYGGWEYKFNASIDNDHPSYTHPWDLSQTNLDFKVRMDSVIDFRKLVFDLSGAIGFSDMYPIPDKTYSHYIEFTSLGKLEIIRKDGLSFHADFYNTKNMQDVRNFVLTAFMSLLIAVFCELLFKWFI